MSFAGKFAGKVVVVAGATGVVGSGVVRSALDAGATVVGISRSSERLDALRQTIGIKPSEPFHAVVGDFNDEAQGEASAAAVAKVLAGRPIDHFVSILGFVTVDAAATQVKLSTFKASLDDSLFNSFIAAKSFLPPMKSRAGATYTIASGGFSHGVFAPNLWLATVKNAALNNLVLALASETANDALRVNSACIHVGVAPVGGAKNQLGLPADRDTLQLGDAFLGIASGDAKGQVICLDKWSDVDRWAGRA